MKKGGGQNFPPPVTSDHQCVLVIFHGKTASQTNIWWECLTKNGHLVEKGSDSLQGLKHIFDDRSKGSTEPVVKNGSLLKNGRGMNYGS